MQRKTDAAIAAGADLVQFYQLDAGHGRQPVVAEQERYFRDLLEATDHPVGLSIHLAVGYLAPSSLVTKLCADYPQIKIVNIPFGPTMNYLVQLQDNISDDIKIYVGMHNILCGLMMGGVGGAGHRAQPGPHLCQSIIDHYVAGDLDKAAEAYAHVLRVTDVIGMGSLCPPTAPKRR